MLPDAFDALALLEETGGADASACLSSEEVQEQCHRLNREAEESGIDIDQSQKKFWKKQSPLDPRWLETIYVELRETYCVKISAGYRIRIPCMTKYCASCSEGLRPGEMCRKDTYVDNWHYFHLYTHMRCANRWGEG